jgi:hypothetical protein
MEEQSFLDILTPLMKPAGIALLIVGVVWGFIEHVAFKLTPGWKRSLAAAIGQACLFYVHWSGLYSFGDGPAGWALVLMLGMFATPLANAAFDKLVTRFAPWAKKQPPAEQMPVTGGQP